MGSTPSNVAVGGTMFQEGAGTYWSASNSAYDGSALGYIPEVVWNESASSGASGASDLWATGGGASNLYTKPTWQVARGVPSDGMRDVPDVALSAAGHDAYLVETVGDDGTDEGLYSISGTSVSSPAFAGLMALIVQSTGGVGLGNPDQEFYVMGNAQYAASPGTTIFHPITSGNNSVPGTTGFSASSTPGYNQATGLGSVDANALVTNWPGAGTIAIATPYASVGLLTGTTATFTATVTGTTSTGVTWTTNGDASISAAGLFKPNAAGSYTVTAAAAAAPSKTVTISVNVHGANLSSTDSGTAVTGMDVLTLLGSYATSNSALELAGGGVIDSADLTILLNQLGW
jgi:hypothetical protein